MTKAERKEEARRERIEIQRKMARARRNRWIGLGVVVVLVAGLGVWWLVRPKPKTFSPDELLAAAPAAAKTASCDAVQTIDPYSPESQDGAHIGAPGSDLTTMPALSSYPSVPPASGPHNPTPLDAGVYDSPPPIDQAIHSLEHAAVVIWYDPSAGGKQLADIKSFFRGSNGDKVIVAPYEYPDQGVAGHLPAGEQMALVAWHHLQTCAKPSLAVAFDFVAHYRSPPFEGEPYKGDAPEPQVPI